MHPVSWLPEPLGILLYWIYLDQTLIAGAFAVLVGGLTIRKISDQIKQSDKQAKEQISNSWEQLRESLRHNRELELDRVKRESRAAKAVLPAALSDVSEYCDQCIEYLRRLEEYSDGEEEIPAEAPLPDFPSQAMFAIASAIKSAEQTDAKKLAAILAAGQVHRSRLKGLRDSIFERGRYRHRLVTKSEIVTAYFDTIGLLKLTERAYLYGRGEEAHIGEMDNAEAAASTARLRYYLESELLASRIESNWPPKFAFYADGLVDW